MGNQVLPVTERPLTDGGLDCTKVPDSSTAASGANDRVSPYSTATLWRRMPTNSFSERTDAA